MFIQIKHTMRKCATDLERFISLTTLISLQTAVIQSLCGITFSVIKTSLIALLQLEISLNFNFNKQLKLDSDSNLKADNFFRLLAVF